MGNTNRRQYLTLGALCATFSAAIAVGLVLAFASGESQAAPTKSEYFAQVAAICRLYGPKLDKIPPPIDVTIPSEVAESVTKVEPILRAEAKAMGKLKPPPELRDKLERWNDLNQQSIAKLAAVLHAANEDIVDLRGIQVNYVAFVVIGARAQKLGHAIGFPSPPC